MSVAIRARRDTAANWTSENPTLGLGELGYETDTGKLKVGDGATAWASLSYAVDGTGGGATSINDLSDVDTDTFPPQQNDLLVWQDVGGWQPGGVIIDLSESQLWELENVSDTAPADGDTLVWNETAGEWVPGAASGGISETYTFAGTSPVISWLFEEELGGVSRVVLEFVNDEAATIDGTMGFRLGAQGFTSKWSEWSQNGFFATDTQSLTDISLNTATPGLDSQGLRLSSFDEVEEVEVSANLDWYRLQFFGSDSSDLDIDAGGITIYEYANYNDSVFTGSFIEFNNYVTGEVTHFGSDYVSMPELPTADPLIAGRLWNDTGTVKVSAG